MPYVVLGLLVVLTVGLTVWTRRRGDRVDGCGAPADPAHDLRMRGLDDAD
jgi:hypothetical protein